jgi:5-methylcytosine-specific restriction endonuclease McrA
MSRVNNVKNWMIKLSWLAPLTQIAAETTRFDTQKLQKPEISGVEYQQGELAGYELREYLLEKWGRQCAYCGAKNIPLEIEHITVAPRRYSVSSS